MAFRDKIALENRIIYNRHDVAAITGTSLETVDKWLHEGLPVFKSGRLVCIERSTLIEWLRAKAQRREGFMRKHPQQLRVVTKDDELFPGVELA